MKNKNLNLFNMTFALFSILLVSSCQKNSDNGQAAPPPAVTVPGVIPKQYGMGNQRCDVTTSYYTCFDFQRTITQNFTSVLQMCTLLRDEVINNNIAYSARQQAYFEQCSNQNVPGQGQGSGGFCWSGQIDANGNCVPNGQNPVIPGIQMKNYQCSLKFKYNSLEGQTILNVPVLASGGYAYLYAFTVKERDHLGGFIKTYRYGTTERYGRIKLSYDPKSSQNLKLSASVGKSLTASIEGSGSRGVSLNINEDLDGEGVPTFHVECKDSEVLSVDPIGQYSDYYCSGSESISGKVTKFEYLTPIDELIEEGRFKFTDSVKFKATSDSDTEGSRAVISAVPKKYLDQVISNTSLFSKTDFSYSGSNYKFKVSCYPKK